MFIMNEFSDIKESMQSLLSDLLLIKWMLGVILAGIISLVVKTFF